MYMHQVANGKLCIHGIDSHSRCGQACTFLVGYHLSRHHLHARRKTLSRHTAPLKATLLHLSPDQNLPFIVSCAASGLGFVAGASGPGQFTPDFLGSSSATIIAPSFGAFGPFGRTQAATAFSYLQPSGVVSMTTPPARSQ